MTVHLAEFRGFLQKYGVSRQFLHLTPGSPFASDLVCDILGTTTGGRELYFSV